MSCTTYNSIVHNHVSTQLVRNRRAKLARKLARGARVCTHTYTHREGERIICSEAMLHCNTPPPYLLAQGPGLKMGDRKGAPFYPSTLLGFRNRDNHHQLGNPVEFQATSRHVDHRSSRLSTRSLLFNQKEKIKER